MEEEIINTSGFYKNDNGNLLYAPNFVYGPYESYSLTKENKDTYSYPIDGWHWFESDQMAVEHLSFQTPNPPPLPLDPQP